MIFNKVIAPKILTVPPLPLPPAAAPTDAVLAEPAAAVYRGRWRGAPLHQLVLHHAHRWRHLCLWQRPEPEPLLFRAGDLGVS